MCQTQLISHHIVRLSTRSYRQRLEAMAPDGYTRSQLMRLNHDLDSFYELLYSQWRTVTAEDYKVFGPQLKVMLQTLNALYHVCNKLPKSMNMAKETEQLGRNYSALQEIDSDIRNFRIKVSQDAEMKDLLQRASEALTGLQK